MTDIMLYMYLKKKFLFFFVLDLYLKTVLLMELY